MTAAHVFNSWDEVAEKEEHQLPARLNDIALYTQEVPENVWNTIPESQVDMESTYENLVGKEAYMFVRFYGCTFSDDIRVLRFKLLSTKNKEFFLAPATQDANRYYGGLSGAMVYHNGKGIGIFTGMTSPMLHLTEDGLMYMRIVPIQKVQEIVQRNKNSWDQKKTFRDVWQERLSN